MPSANRFGEIFQVTTFGESHGHAIGCVIDGCPAGIAISTEQIQNDLDRRRPGKASWTSARQEPDNVEILSGVFQGKSLGTPIAAIIRNVDARSSDYNEIQAAVETGSSPVRVGHADDLWREKFGHSDVRGGGRASGRETATRVLAGAIAKQLVAALAENLRVISFSSAVGTEKLEASEYQAVLKKFEAGTLGADSIDKMAARFPSAAREKNIEALLVDAVKSGKSYGGAAEILISGVPRGTGQPVFHKLKSDLLGAYLSIGATAGAEFGAGFSSSDKEGTQFHHGESVEQYGGIRGGLATGELVSARVAFKPTSTVMDAAKKGRHDPCIVPRAIPVLEAMTWLVLADHLLWSRLDRV
ncbi:MAG: chorismate synthase [Deltaproteobacteria bacterium]|nr:chorismate synthase [Deltaproteobacteria bacterium]